MSGLLFSHERTESSMQRELIEIAAKPENERLSHYYWLTVLGYKLPEHVGVEMWRLLFLPKIKKPKIREGLTDSEVGLDVDLGPQKGHTQE